LNVDAPRILVDEDLPPRLATALANELGSEVFCSSVRDEGWRGIRNGELLTRMVQHRFTILVSADRNLPKQQHLGRLNLAVIVVIRPLQRAAVLGRVAAIAAAVRTIQAGESIEVAFDQ
jgi:hypothetical protein